MRQLITVAAVAAFLAALAMPDARAITNGTPDGNLHPQVGFVVADYGGGERDPGCSGVLVSPTVFLTAGHCTWVPTVLGFHALWVTFDPVFDPSTSKFVRAASWAYHPDFEPASLQNDVGVVILSKPVRGVPYATLPTARLLDQMQADGTLQSQTFTTVGYGCIGQQGGGPPTETCDYVRRYGTSPYAALTPYFLKVFMNDNADPTTSATQNHDSGAPTFLGDSLTVVGVHSWGLGYGQPAIGSRARVDTASARAFLGQFVTLP